MYIVLCLLCMKNDIEQYETSYNQEEDHDMKFCENKVIIT